MIDMKKTVKYNEEEKLIRYYRKLTIPKRREALDFVSYLMTKSEWDATCEILEDKNMLMGIREGLEEVNRGEVSKVEL